MRIEGNILHLKAETAYLTKDPKTMREIHKLPHCKRLSYCDMKYLTSMIKKQIIQDLKENRDGVKFPYGFGTVKVAFTPNSKGLRLRTAHGKVSSFLFNKALSFSIQPYNGNMDGFYKDRLKIYEECQQ